MTPRQRIKPKPPTHRAPTPKKAGDAIAELLTFGMGRDMADMAGGLAGAGARTGRAFNGFVMSWLDSVDPRQITFEQGVEVTQLMIGVTNAVATIHEASLKPDLSGGGQEIKPITGSHSDGPVVEGMAAAIAVYRKHGED